jgi:hypothetical protein
MANINTLKNILLNLCLCAKSFVIVAVGMSHTDVSIDLMLFAVDDMTRHDTTRHDTNRIGSDRIETD